MSDPHDDINRTLDTIMELLDKLPPAGRLTAACHVLALTICKNTPPVAWHCALDLASTQIGEILEDAP